MSVFLGTTSTPSHCQLSIFFPKLHSPKTLYPSFQLLDPIIHFLHGILSELLRAQPGHIISVLKIFQGIVIATGYSSNYIDRLLRPLMTWSLFLISLNLPLALQLYTVFWKHHSLPYLWASVILSFYLKLFPWFHVLFPLVFHFKLCFLKVFLDSLK